MIRREIGLLLALANLDPAPESVPINALVPVPGTPLGDSDPVEPLDFVRLIAVAQALCFMAGANSVFTGEALLTTPNQAPSRDAAMFASLGITGESV